MDELPDKAPEPLGYAVVPSPDESCGVRVELVEPGHALAAVGLSIIAAVVGLIPVAIAQGWFSGGRSGGWGVFFAVLFCWPAAVAFQFHAIVDLVLARRERTWLFVCALLAVSFIAIITVFCCFRMI